MFDKFKLRTGVAALAAAAAVLGSVAMTDTVKAAVGDSAFPGVTLAMTPANGSSGTVFGLGFTSTATGQPVSAACPGDNPTGWFWTAFIVPAGTDIGALTFSAPGSPVPPTVLPPGQNASQFRPLARPNGTFLRSEFPGLVDGAITAPAGLWLGNVPLPAGAYQVGIACYDSNSTLAQGGINLTGRFYSTPIAVTSNTAVLVTNPQGYTYAAVPPAPSITTVPVTETGATVNFTHAVSTPATTGYTATVTPTAPAGAPLAPINVPAADRSFAVTGLTTGTTYSVTLQAMSAAGPSPVSNMVSFTPPAAPQAPAPQPPAPPTLTPPSSPSFVPLTPARVLDTRASGKVGDAAGSAAPHVLQVTGRGRVPASGVGAVAFNVTVVAGENPTIGGGYVTVYPCGTRPDASNLNFTTGQTIPNSVISPLSASGTVCFYVYGTAHILADVAGYFPAGSGFTSLSPARVLNTRAGAKVGNAAGTGAPFVLKVTGQGSVPASGVGAVALNVTVTQTENPTIGGGFVTVYPCGTRPDASNLNFVAGQTIPNSVIAPVSASGEVCFYVYGTAHLLADVSGYLAA